MDEYKTLKNVFLVIASGAGIGFAGRFTYQFFVLNYDIFDLLPTLVLSIVFILSIPVIFSINPDD